MNRLIRRIVVLVSVFLVATGAFWWTNRAPKEESVTYTVMEKATLPVVSFGFEGRWINTQRGYTKEMDTTSFRSPLTPLSSERRMQLQIETFGEEVKAVDFELRTNDAARLIERGACESLEKTEQGLIATLAFQDLLSSEEYRLCVVLQTKKHEQIRYYTRIQYCTGYPIGEMLVFAENFSARTFQKSEAEELRQYLETSAAASGQSLAHVTIQSTFDQVTWGNLMPVREVAPTIYLYDLAMTTGNLALRYEIAAENENGERNEFSVEEAFTLRKANATMYLLDYERTMNQDFQPSKKTIVNGVFELGVLEESRAQLLVEQNKNFSVFDTAGELWEYDNAKNQLVRVFSFKQEGVGAIRTAQAEHDFQVIRLEENGNMEFLVYGYMSRGDFEGQCGLAFYRYDYELNELAELFFLPSDQAFETMKHEIRVLASKQPDKVLYLMMEGALYTIDFEGNEVVRIAGTQAPEYLAVSDDNSCVAWMEEDSICRMNLQEEKTYRIQAKDGEALRLVGFIANDLIYGFAKADEPNAMSVDREVPMYAIEIVDPQETIQIHYEKENVYLLEVTVNNDRILMQRAVKADPGLYQKIEEDTLIRNMEKAEMAQSPVSYYATEKRQRVYQLNLAAKKPSEEEFFVVIPKRIAEETLTLLSVERTETSDCYYAYANGVLLGIYSHTEEAVEAAYDAFGVVTDKSQRKVWERLNYDGSHYVDTKHLPRAHEKSEALAACMSYWTQSERMDEWKAALAEESNLLTVFERFGLRGYDFSGCSVQRMVYFLNQEIPVIYGTNEGKYEMLIGYDRNNFSLYDPVSGNVRKMARSDAETYFAQQGNVFISALR